jgi:WD40 repeat protein
VFQKLKQNKSVMITKNLLYKIILWLFILNSSVFAQNIKEKQILWTADWSPNGKYIAIGGNIDSLKIYEAKSLKLYKSYLVKGTITRVKWHPNKNVIAVAIQISEDKSMLLNLDTNSKIELNEISPEGARGIDWNYNGEFLAVADNDGQITLFNDKGELIKKFANENNSTKGITAIDWHPSKNIFVTVSDKIRILSTEGNLLKTIKHRDEDVLLLSVAWHKSGSFFVTGDYGYETYKSLLQYWDEEGNLIKSNDVSVGEYRNLTWNPKGNRLASASDTLRIWNEKGNLISEGASKEYLWGISWNKNGKKIITTSAGQTIALWNQKAELQINLE